MAPAKRIPAPATTHAASRHSSKLRARAASLFRPPHLYRTLTSLVIVVTPLLALLVYYTRPHAASALPDWNRLSDAFVHVRRWMRRALRLYQRQLHLHPLWSRAVTAGVIFFIADLLAQLLNRRASKPTPAPFSAHRLARYSLYGLFMMGPFLYIWYALMNEYGPEDDFRGSLLKCLFEQITLEPVCISMYITYDGIVCHRGWRAIKNKLDAQFFPLLFKNAVFWLPANFANYYIGTPDLRVVFANLCSLFWNIYFSAKVNKIAVTSFVVDKGPKYSPLLHLEREEASAVPSSTSTSNSYQSGETTARRSGDTIASARTSKTLIV